MLRRAPIRLRLTLWYVLLLAVILVAFSAGVYLLLRHDLYQNLNESLEAQADGLRSGVQFEGERPVFGGQLPPGSEERFARVFDASGEVTWESAEEIGQMPVDEGAVMRALAGEPSRRSVRPIGDDDRIRVIAVPIIREGAVVGVMEVGRPEEEVSETLGSLLLILGIALPVTLVVAGFGGVFLAGRALSPIDRIRRAARRMSAEDLGQRLDLDLPDDEVGKLARTFDEMIGRLDDAFGRQRQFTSDTSHEIRTPLTIIKGQIEVSLQRERGGEEYRRVLRAVNEEVDRLIRMAGSLLTLTRADAGQIPLRIEDVDVPGIERGVVEQLRPSASAKGVGLEVEEGPVALIEADEDLLLQLMLNLVDNAIKYTPKGGRVNVGWRLGGGGVEVWVKDTGAGIPEEHVPYLFDRFYRVDKARSRSEGGVGLGLAISRWIAEAHGGGIRVESAPGAGSTFTVALPGRG